MRSGAVDTLFGVASAVKPLVFQRGTFGTNGVLPGLRALVSEVAIHLVAPHARCYWRIVFLFDLVMRNTHTEELKALVFALLRWSGLGERDLQHRVVREFEDTVDVFVSKVICPIDLSLYFLLGVTSDVVVDSKEDNGPS